MPIINTQIGRPYAPCAGISPRAIRSCTAALCKRCPGAGAADALLFIKGQKGLARAIKGQLQLARARARGLLLRFNRRRPARRR